MRASFNIPGPSFPSTASWPRRDAVGVTDVEQTVIGIEHLAGKKEGDRGVVLADLEPPALGELPDAVEPAGADIAAAPIRGNAELEAGFEHVALDGGADTGVALQVPLRGLYGCLALATFLLSTEIADSPTCSSSLPRSSLDVIGLPYGRCRTGSTRWPLR